MSCLRYRRPIRRTHIHIHTSEYVSENPSYLLGTLSKPNEPRHKVEHLLRWQSDVLRIMNENSSLIPAPPVVDPGEKLRDDSGPVPGYRLGLFHTRTIHLVCDSKMSTGKLTLLKALKYSEPNRFLIIQGIPNVDELINLTRDARLSGWTGDSLIINTGYQESHTILDNSIEGIAKVGATCGCCNLWVFTNVIPQLNKVYSCYWKIYKIFADWTRGMLSFLEPMSYQEASAERTRSMLHE